MEVATLMQALEVRLEALTKEVAGAPITRGRGCSRTERRERAFGRHRRIQHRRVAHRILQGLGFKRP